MRKIVQNISVRVIQVLILMATFVSSSQAHVKWFVSEDELPDSGFLRYSVNDTAVMIWIGLALLMVVSSLILDSRLPCLSIADTKAKKILISILRVCTGISLLLTAYHGAIVAPHYMVVDSFSRLLLAIEFTVGILLLLNIFIFYSAMLLLIFYFGVMFQFGFLETIEYWHIIGIGLFLMFNNFTNPIYEKKLKPYSVSVLRILTGIALVTLGLSEKLLSAEYGEAFVSEYQWNFVQNMGLEFFSDRLFVLSAGVMEVVFGIILILGTTTRLNILVVSGFMLTSNITFFIEGNIAEAIVEIIGHLPIIAIAVICVFFGSGQKLKATSLFKKSIKESEVYD